MPVLEIAGALLVAALGWLLLRNTISYILRVGKQPALSEALFPGKLKLPYLAGALMGALVACSLLAHHLLFWYRTPLVKGLLLLAVIPVAASALGAIFQAVSKTFFKRISSAKVVGIWAFAFIFLVALFSTLTTWRTVLPPGTANPHYELRFSRPAGRATETEAIELVEVKLFSALNAQVQRLTYGACKGNDAHGWLGSEVAPADNALEQNNLVCSFQAQPGDYVEVLLKSNSEQTIDVWVNDLHYTQNTLDDSLRFLPIGIPLTAYSLAATIMDNVARLAIPGLLLFVAIGVVLDRNWLPFPLLALGLFALVSATLLLRNAWVVEDQFITMRVIENLVHGYGPNFNVGYRVQAFTHPLWMLLLAVIYFFANQIFPAAGFSSLYYVTVISSLTLTALSFALIFWIGHKRDFALAFFGATLLQLSKSFMDYSLSGLENALVNVLLLAFLWYALHSDRNEQSLFWPFFIASCVVITRQDTLLLLLPALLLLVWQSRDKLQTWSTALMGLFPVIAWHSFSLIYYGFLVPNTAFAKLNTGIPRVELIEQGLAYFANAARWDLVTILAIVLALLLALRQRDPHHGALSLGILAYLLYIVWIGGDFMSGRFLVAPLVMSVGLLITHLPRRKIMLTALAALTLLGLLNERSPLYANQNYGQTIPVEAHYDSQISDERSVFFAQTALLRNSPERGLAQNRWYTWQISPEFPLDVLEMGSIGIPGYLPGPNYVLVDIYALADPLLSKLPATNITSWRIGHFERRVPEGYLQTLFGEENHLEDPNLAAYWEKLQQLIQGNIWSVERFITILEMNTGQYQPLLDAYTDPQ